MLAEHGEVRIRYGAGEVMMNVSEAIKERHLAQYTSMYQAALKSIRRETYVAFTTGLYYIQRKPWILLEAGVRS